MKSSAVLVFLPPLGGICVFCQNALLVGGTGISLKWYLLTRLPIGLFCAGFCALCYPLLPQQAAECFGSFTAPAGMAALSAATPLGSGLDGGTGNLFVVKRRKT